MIVGFLGFGEVASVLSGCLKDCGVEVYTSIENRSLKTQTRAKEQSINICKDNRGLAEISDILISSVTPAEAVNIAKEVGGYTKGIYVDINNISPLTARTALSYIRNGKTVDAAIMGGVKKEVCQVLIIASGEYAVQFSMLNEYGLNIRVLNHDIGRAKTLKMLRSYYTKGVSALLFESLLKAYQLGVDDEFLKCLAITECPEFRKSTISRIINSALHAKRKSEEMYEVLKFIEDESHLKLKQNEHKIMAESTKEFFKTIFKNIKPNEEPDGYKEIFELFKN